MRCRRGAPSHPLLSFSSGIWDASPVGRSSSKSEYLLCIGWLIASVGFAFQRPDALARNELSIIQESTNIFGSTAPTLYQEVPSMSRSSRDGVQSWTESMTPATVFERSPRRCANPRSVQLDQRTGRRRLGTTNLGAPDARRPGPAPPRRVASCRATSRTTRASSSPEVRRSSRRTRASCGTDGRDHRGDREWQACCDIETWPVLRTVGRRAPSQVLSSENAVTSSRSGGSGRIADSSKHGLERFDETAAREQMTDGGRPRPRRSQE